MITSDLGKQNRSFFYNQGLISSQFNQIFSKTFPVGIYDGGDVQYVSAYQIKVLPIAVIIQDSGILKGTFGPDEESIEGKDIAVRIRTTSPITLTLASPIDEKPLLVARYSWQSTDGETDVNTGKLYMNIFTVQDTESADHSNPSMYWDTDLILGKLNFVGEGNDSVLNQYDVIDYTRKSVSPLMNELLSPRLRVRAPKESEDQDKVYVETGIIRGRNDLIIVSGASPAIKPTVGALNNRTDYVYVDDEGAIKVEEGAYSTVYPAPPKPFYGRKVIAKIQRVGDRDTIRGSEIIACHNDPVGSVKARDLLVDDSSAYYTKTGGFLDIEQALKQVWEKSIRSVFSGTDPNESNVKIFRHAEGTRFETENTRDSVVIKGGVGGDQSLKVTVSPTTLTANRTLTLADGNTVLSTGTMNTIDTEQIITGLKKFHNSDGTRFSVDASKDGIILKGGDAGNNGFAVTITPTSLSTNRSVTLPDGNVVLRKGEQVTVDSTVEQTILSLKNFAVLPKLIAEGTTLVPTEESHAVPKNYVDAVSTALSTHANLTTGSDQTTIPHGIKQGHNNGFNADMLDGAHLSTDGNLASGSDAKVATEKAVKAYADTKLPKSAGSGQKLTGDLYTRHLYPDGNNAWDFGYDGMAYRHAWFTGTVNANQFNYTSTRNKKKDIESFTRSGLDIVKKLAIVNYKYKEDLLNQNHIGVIAEDSPKEILSKDGKSVSLADSIGILFKAVQELSDFVGV